MTTTEKRIIWIASYPKSGNTWVRFMLLNLLYGPQHASEKLDVHIPDIHKSKGRIWVPADRNALVKTHFMLSASMPFFEHTAGFIYIVRNPMDVMISNLNYAFASHGVGSDRIVRDGIKRQYIEQFIDNCGDPRWIQLGRGSWTDNVTSWMTNEPGFADLVLRYEDLLADPGLHLGQVSSFLDINASPSDLRLAVENSSFDRMKAIEEAELASRRPGFYLSETTEKSIVAGNRFMYRGIAGHGAQELTPEQRGRFLTQFGPGMKLAGYRLPR